MEFPPSLGRDGAERAKLLVDAKHCVENLHYGAPGRKYVVKLEDAACDIN